MKTIEKERIIPSRTVKDTVYVAEDGKKFSVKSECIAYEKEINDQKTKKELNFKYLNSKLSINSDSIISVCTLKDKNDIHKL